MWGSNIANKHRHHHERDFEGKDMLKLLEKRVKQIEQTIDSHIRECHGPKNVSKFKGLSYDQKLQYLLEIQSEITDINHNSIAQNRMRMIGLTQSYNLFDQQIFLKISKMKQALEDDPNYKPVVTDILGK